MKNVLSIAGSDCSAGAGIQADLKTFVANGVYGMTVITSLTAQNTKEVRMVEDVSIEMLKNQLEAILDVMKVSAIKIGMINSKENGEVIYDTLSKYKAENIVLDPVMISTSGRTLIKNETNKGRGKCIFMHNEDCLRRIGAHSTRVSAYDKEIECFLRRKGLCEQFAFVKAAYSCRIWAIRPSLVSKETPRNSKFGCSRVISMDSQTNSPANSTASAIS